MSELSSSALPKPSPASLRFRRTVRAWIPTFLWVATIAMFSTDLFSSAHTGQVLLKIVHAIYGRISEHSFILLHAYVRKAAHFSVYGILSGLAFYSWRTSIPGRLRWTFTWSGLSLALTLLIASLDEFHQSFIPSRTASFQDVLLDMMGAMFVQTLIASFTGSSQRSAIGK